MVFLLLPTFSNAQNIYDQAIKTLHLSNVSVDGKNYKVDMQHQGNLIFKVIKTTLISNPPPSSSSFSYKTGQLKISAVCVNSKNLVTNMIHHGDLVFKLTSVTPTETIKNDAPSICPQNSQNDNPPVINTFTAEKTTSTPIIKVSIDASDDNDVAGWLISENASPPNLLDTNWKSTPPTFYSIFSPGQVTLYAWTKDTSGNLSNVATQTINYSLPTQYSNYLSDEFLQTPQNAINFITVSANFWIASQDKLNGGFFTNVDQQGKVLANKNKSFLTQSRNAYGFAKAFMVTGDDRYLEYARHALEFMYDYGWDTTHDGWYFIANEHGDINSGSGWSWDHNTKTKWSFQQHYSLLGIAALYEANRRETEYSWLTRGYNSNETHLWDNDVNN